MGSNNPDTMKYAVPNHRETNHVTPRAQNHVQAVHSTRREEPELEAIVIEELEHDPDALSTEDLDTRSHFTTGTTSAGGVGLTRTRSGSTKASLPTTTDPRGAPSGSIRDSLVSPSVRARHQPPPALPRRTDFGEYFPDGGWGWVVCGGVFVVQFLSHGFYLAGGTLLQEIITEFGSGESFTVWMCSLSYAVVYTLTPLVVALCRRKSPRLFALVGGLLAALAALFMSFCTQVHQLFVIEVVVMPFGAALSQATASVILGRYFHKRREVAEMLALCGSGVGMAVISVFESHIFSSLEWMPAMQSMVGLLLPALIAGALYRTPSIYHPRRRVILHLKSLAKTKKQRQDFEDPPPYFDFKPLRMRALRLLMLSTATTSVGTYVPFLLLPRIAFEEKMERQSYSLLMVFMGVAFAFGCLLVGLTIIRNNLRCMIARQHLCQMTSFGCGVVALLFTLAEGFDAFALFVWVYGLLCGGYMYAIRMYTYELVTVKLAERCLGYLTFAQGIPVLLGVPMSRWLGVSTSARYGFVFAGIFMILGSLMMFFMPRAEKHSSNHEVIQAAHLACKSYEEDIMFAGMEVSDDCSHTNKHSRNTSTNMYDDAGKGHKAKLSTSAWNYGGCKFGAVTEEENLSADLGAMTPMSPTDKVTEFLVHSQTMLQTFSHRHNIELPNVKLEINNQYTSDPEEARSEDEIRDLTLQATVCRNSPHRGRSRTKSVATRSEVEAAGELAEAATHEVTVVSVESWPPRHVQEQTVTAASHIVEETVHEITTTV